MKIALVFFQILAALALIIAVLLHMAKGEGLGGIGGQARIFGTPKGLEEGLDKITTGCALIFILISIVLSLMA